MAAVCVEIAASEKKSGEEEGGGVGRNSFGVQGRVERKNAVLRERRVPRERDICLLDGRRDRRWRA